MLIGDSIVVITDGGEGSCLSVGFDFLDSMGIQCIFVVNNGMEGDDISFF